MKPVRSPIRVVGRFVGRFVGSVAVVALLGACGDGEPVPAAVVDGTEISQQSVADELEAIAANADYLDVLQQGSGPVLGDDEGSFDSDFVVQVLARQIQYTIITNEVAKRGLEVDDACRAAARDEIVRGLAGFSADGDGEPIYEAFPESYRDQLVTWNAALLMLQGDLAGQPCVDEAAIEDYFEEHRAELTEVCARHILVATAAEAQAVEDDLAGGADFATLATERSTDTGSGAQGGDLGCAAAGGYVPEFQDAVLNQDIGVVGDPVESQFGFHVIVVDSRDDPVLDDVRDEVANLLAQEVQAGFGEWFSGALTTAEVTVDDRYGTWDAANAAITRPADGADEGTDPTDPTTEDPTTEDP